MCAEAASERKARDIVILNLSGLGLMADYVVICDGTSDRHVSGIVENVLLRNKEKGLLPLGAEGMRGGRWALLDYGGVVIHVFHAPVREYYNLEGLWPDVDRLYTEEFEAAVGTTNT